MITWEDVAIIYGSDFLAKGTQRAFVEVDKMAPDGIYGAKWSQLLNIGLALGIPVAVIMSNKIKAPYDKVLTLMGGQFATKIFDYVEEALLPAGMKIAELGYAPGVMGTTPTPQPMRGSYTLVA